MRHSKDIIDTNVRSAIINNMSVKYLQILESVNFLSILIFPSLFPIVNMINCSNRIGFRVMTGIRVRSLYAFECIAVRTPYECSELCERRKMCKSANFVIDEQRCYLNAVTISNETAVKNTSAEYIEKGAIDSVSD